MRVPALSQEISLLHSPTTRYFAGPVVNPASGRLFIEKSLTRERPTLGRLPY
jgi:hypothetical protein